MSVNKRRPYWLAAITALSMVLPLLVGLVLTASPAKADVLPSGFVTTQLGHGLNNPTAMTLTPDGRILVAEQGGKLRVIKNGALLSAAALTLTVNRTSESGFDGITIDPSFATNQYIYVYYTATTPNPHNRVSRFTMNGDTVDPSTELVLLDIDDLTGFQHNGGALHFGPDGYLYVAVGDNYTPTNAQDMTTLKGKLLRIASDGTIPSDNPFYNTNTGKYRAIWAYGLRNPYTFDFQPGTGRMFIDDVGETSFEEINDGKAGANYGWPITEGYTSDPRFVGPLYAYPHGSDDASGCAIVGGTFYNPATVAFPSSYVGKYFFVDFCNHWMKTYDPVTGAVSDFGTALPSQPLEPVVAPDGSMYYISRIDSDGLGSVDKITYTGSLAPTIGTQPASQLVSTGHPATFSVSASGNSPLTYQWYRDGTAISGATSASYTSPNLTSADDGAQFTVVVTNGYGSATSDPATVTMTTAQPPTPTITSPDPAVLWAGGQTINYAGTATDPQDGALPASAYTWRVDQGHHAPGTPNAHFHPFVPPTSGATSGAFTIPYTSIETEPDIYFRIYLTVTDSAGLSTTTYEDIQPHQVSLTLDAAPSGLLVSLDGTPHTTPYTFVGVEGIQRDLSVLSPQSYGGNTYRFSSWSDGLAASHSFRTPATATTYTATYSNTPRTGSISLSSNPVQVCDGSGFGQTTVSWDDTSVSSVEVHIDAPNGSTFATAGQGPQSRDTGKWVGEGTTLYLQDTTAGAALTSANTLATVTAHLTTSGCPATPPGTGVISASPNPIQVCDGTGQGVTTVSWNSSGTAAVEVHLNSPTGPKFAAGPTGANSATTGKWVNDGMQFYLQDVSGGRSLTADNTLAVSTVNVSTAGCPGGTISAAPSTIQVCDSSGQGATTLSWNDQNVTAVEVHIGSPSGQAFATTGPGPQTRATGTWVTDGMKFYLQNTSGGLPLSAANTLATVVVHVTTAGCAPAGSVSAVPATIVVCDGSGTGTTTLNWTSSGVSAVEVHIGAPTGPLFAGTGVGSKSRTTGNWVTDGMTFYLQNTTGGAALTSANTLAKVTVHVTTAGCPPTGSISATPNPATVCDGNGTTAVTIKWSVVAVTAAEVRVNSRSGPTFAAAGPGVFTRTTGNWVTDGMTFYLQNSSDPAQTTAAASTLATVTVKLTRNGCVVTGTVKASPNPVQVCDGTGKGVTTLTWSATNALSVEVRVGSSTGPVFSTRGPSASQTTDKWVTDGMVFYLMDTSNGRTAATTIATETVHLTTSGCATPAVRA